VYREKKSWPMSFYGRVANFFLAHRASGVTLSNPSVSVSIRSRKLRHNHPAGYTGQNRSIYTTRAAHEGKQSQSRSWTSRFPFNSAWLHRYCRTFSSQLFMRFDAITSCADLLLRGWFLGVPGVDGGGEWRGPPRDQGALATRQAPRCSFSSLVRDDSFMTASFLDLLLPLLATKMTLWLNMLFRT
jgi:hypothetical protein